MSSRCAAWSRSGGRNRARRAERSSPVGSRPFVGGQGEAASYSVVSWMRVIASAILAEARGPTSLRQAAIEAASASRTLRGSRPSRVVSSGSTPPK